ncbi:PAS domain S-box protein [Guyparkeria halophila]|uniref:PAS domain S-box protein n=1 Tax=Guyparkeria halophila TaxID=47960 RepID=A0ABZ0YU82_9GAMM|nr:PAS domain S-box protein [Guyparkeria halophila]WQH15736.1 PAS domain S-box protein [Guyparkeria halophila]
MADATYDAVLITDAEVAFPGPRIVYVNESLCQMAGYRPEDLIGRTPRIFQGAETDRSVLDELRACLEQGRPFEGSTINYRRDGSPYLVQWKTVPVPDDTGQPRYFVSVQKDLTHLIRAESFADTLLKSLGEGVFGIDSEGRFTFLNPQALATLGYASQDQLLGRPSHELIHTDPSGRHAHPIEDCLVHRVLRTGQRLDAQEDTYFRADGTPVPVEVYATPIQTLDRRLDGVVGVFRDISERLATRRALQERNERLESVIVGANAGTWEWDLESDALTVNDIWLQLLGLERADSETLCGKDWRERVHPEDWPLVERQIQRYLDGQDRYYEVEFRIRHAQGHWVWLLARGKISARDMAGKPLRFAGTHLDVSAIKHSEQARLDSQRKYRALFDAMNDVAVVFPFEAAGFGGFVEVNQEACRQLGYGRDELLRRGPGDLVTRHTLRRFDQEAWREGFR